MSNENLIVPRFFIHTSLNEVKSRDAGRPIYDEFEACEIRFSANKQTVGVFPAHEVFTSRRDALTGEVTQITYAMEHNPQYLKFKDGAAQVLAGTPLGEAPFLSASKRLELKALSIHTVEALASLGGQSKKQLGMSADALIAQAKAYLDNAAGSADVLALAAKNAALEARLAVLEGRSTGQVSDDVPDDEADGDAPEPEVAASPFFDMSADDIKNWIHDATKERPKGNPSHATLVKRADEVNAELTKKNKAAA